MRRSVLHRMPSKPAGDAFVRHDEAAECAAQGAEEEAAGVMVLVAEAVDARDADDDCMMADVVRATDWLEPVATFAKANEDDEPLMPDLLRGVHGHGVGADAVRPRVPQDLPARVDASVCQYALPRMSLRSEPLVAAYFHAGRGGVFGMIRKSSVFDLRKYSVPVQYICLCLSPLCPQLFP